MNNARDIGLSVAGLEGKAEAMLSLLTLRKRGDNVPAAYALALLRGCFMARATSVPLATSTPPTVK